MKNMKRISHYLLLATTLLAVFSFTVLSNSVNMTTAENNNYLKQKEAVEPLAEEGYYVFMTIDGIYDKGRKGYLSKILYYSGYKACQKEGYRFESEAESAFREYLKAEYSNAFPYNVNNIITYSGKAYSSVSAKDIKTMQQAQESVNHWIAGQKEDGNSVVRTDFSFVCE